MVLYIGIIKELRLNLNTNLSRLLSIKICEYYFTKDILNNLAILKISFSVKYYF